MSSSLMVVPSPDVSSTGPETIAGVGHGLQHAIHPIRGRERKPWIPLALGNAEQVEMEEDEDEAEAILRYSYKGLD